MKKTIFVLLAALVTINIWAGEVTPPSEFPTYYKDVDGKSGDDLFSGVTTVTRKGYKSIGYDNLWNAYKSTDTYPEGHAKEGQVWDMYSNCPYKHITNKCGTYGTECDCYNREHSIPQSWWGKGTSNQGCDIFHVVPTDGKVNGERSNWAFGEVTGTPKYQYDGAKRGTGASITIENTVAGDFTASAPSTVFEPVDEYKGDFARGYFGTLLSWPNVKMTQDHGNEVFTGTNTKAGNYGLTKYGLALLLKWHRQDPVSQKEVDRNNGIQKEQGNRNPFIDYPDLAEYIWGAHAGEKFTISGGGCTKLATPNVAAVAGNKQVTLTWTVVDGAKNYTVTISNGVGYTTECLTDAVIGTVTISGDVCTCIITGLTNGLVYTTSVKANADNSTCDSDIDQDQVTPEADPTPVTYQIRFLNGETVLQDEMLEAGVLPVYKGATPTKAPDTQYTYTFSKWSPDIAVVTKSQDYAAQFNATPLDPTSVKVIEAPQEQVRKVMINGLLYIQRGDNIYDVTGRLVK